MMKTSRFLYASSQTKECVDKIEVKVKLKLTASVVKKFIIEEKSVSQGL